MDFAGYSKEFCLKLFWENLVSVGVGRIETFFTWCHSFYRFFFFEGFNQKLSLFCSLLLLYFIEENYLLIVFCRAKRSSLDEVSENSWFSKLVDKSIGLSSVFLGPKFLKIKTVPRINSIRNGTIFIVNIFEKLAVIRHNLGHKLKKSISYFNIIHTVLWIIIRVNKYCRKGEICHF